MIGQQQTTTSQLILPWIWQPETPVTARLVIRHELGGLRPSLACAQRLLWFRGNRLAELLSAVHLGVAQRALYESAVLENPERIAQMERDYFDAAMWERKRYGNIKAEFTTRLGVAA